MQECGGLGDREGNPISESNIHLRDSHQHILGCCGGVGAVPLPSLTACLSICLSVWVQCSVTCGEGVQQRQVVCKGSDSGAHCEGDKPEAIQGCHMALCPGERRSRRWHCLWGSSSMNASSLL